MEGLRCEQQATEERKKKKSINQIARAAKKAVKELEKAVMPSTSGEKRPGRPKKETAPNPSSAATSTSGVKRRPGRPKKISVPDSDSDDDGIQLCANCGKMLDYVITNIQCRNRKCGKYVHFRCADQTHYFLCKCCVSEPDDEESDEAMETGK